MILCFFPQYMQQQSQIFVFSTMLANKGAEAVLHGQFPSIIAYHCAQPGTKKFLEVSFPTDFESQALRRYIFVNLTEASPEVGPVQSSEPESVDGQYVSGETEANDTRQRQSNDDESWR